MIASPQVIMPSPNPDRRAPAIRPFTIVTMNGFEFWPEELPAGAEETSALRIRRAFEVQSPHGEHQRCSVDVTTAVREFVQAEARRVLPPAERIWDTVCTSTLADYLWRQDRMPPGVLVVFELTDRQVQTVRHALNLGLPKRT